MSTRHIRLRESPAKEFATRHAFTERRTALSLGIQEALDRHEFLFKTLMGLDYSTLKPGLGLEAFQIDASREGVAIGRDGLLCYPGVVDPPWAYEDEELRQLVNRTRFLIISGSNEMPFFLHSTLDEHGDVVWDWRDLRDMKEDNYMASLLVLKFSVEMLVNRDLGRLFRVLLAYNPDSEVIRSAHETVRHTLCIQRRRTSKAKAPPRP